MKKYEYKFVEVERQIQKGATFNECQSIIVNEAEKGWRLSQVVTVFNERLGISSAMGYQIILEKEVE